MAATKAKKTLRHGYTTGACAAAAAKGAALMLRDQGLVASVEILLPAGFSATFALHGQRFDATSATCYVIKDAGDDPDVTNGCEVWVEVTVTPPGPPLAKGGSCPSPLPSLPSEGAIGVSPPLQKGGCPQGGGVTLFGGPGIGRVTKPGLAVAVGEWAINPVPRRMIEEAVGEVFSCHPSPACGQKRPSARRPVTCHCTISIPDGEERSKRTLNARLGILGGLSILGTTGVVKPISTRAWTDTLDAALDVAVASGCSTVVLSTGRTSELVAQKSPPPSPPVSQGGCPKGGGVALPEEAYIMMGDHVGYALRACAARAVDEVILCGQFAKLLKIACGHEQTHVNSSRLDLNLLADWLEAAIHASPACGQKRPSARRPVTRHCRQANTAREVLEVAHHDRALIELVCERARAFAATLAPSARIKVLLAGYGGEVLYFR